MGAGPGQHARRLGTPLGTPVGVGRHQAGCHPPGRRCHRPGVVESPVVACHPRSRLASGDAGPGSGHLHTHGPAAPTRAESGGWPRTRLDWYGHHVHGRSEAVGRHPGDGVGSAGGRPMGPADRSATQPTGPGVVCPAYVGRGRLPVQQIDGLGLAARAVAEPGCGGLAVSGGGGRYAVDPGHRHAD